ncbi:MAG: hypothetical protein V1859_05700 [archaeon]
MKKILLLLIILLVGCTSESQMKKEIEKANYCSVGSDCINIGNHCPFGCSITVNKAEAEKLENKLKFYVSDCIYDCMRCPDVRCAKGKCEAICS